MQKFISKLGLSIALVAMFATNINLKYDDDIIPSSLLFVFGVVLFFSADQ